MKLKGGVGRISASQGNSFQIKRKGSICPIIAQHKKNNNVEAFLSLGTQTPAFLKLVFLFLFANHGPSERHTFQRII